LLNDTPDPWSSPDDLLINLEEDHLVAAKETAGKIKGERWSACFSTGLLVGDHVELRDQLVRILVDAGYSISTVTDTFCLSSQEVWNIVVADPISLYQCLECRDPLPLRDIRDYRRLQRAHAAAYDATPGDRRSADLFCGVCTETLLRRRNERGRRERRARETRISRLQNMSYAEYLLTDHWRAIKKAALAWAGQRCQVCNRKDEELHVHHRVYTRRGCERPEDLTVLCRTHHALFHEKLQDAS
jgi:hypothetical protein